MNEDEKTVVELQPSSFTFRQKVGFEAKIYFHSIDEIRPKVERILTEWLYIEQQLGGPE